MKRMRIKKMFIGFAVIGGLFLNIKVYNLLSITLISFVL